MIVRREPISPEDLLLPVVNVGSNKRPTYLPSHLCMVMPGQISKLKLDTDQTKVMIKFAVRDPNLNAESIMSKGFGTLGFEDNDRLVAFPSFNDSCDAYELTKTGTLRNSCGEEYEETQWPLADAANPFVPKDAALEWDILEPEHTFVPKACETGQLGLFKDQSKFPRRPVDPRWTMPQTTQRLFVPFKIETYHS